MGSYGRHPHTGIIISVALAVIYCLQHCTFSFLDILYLSHQEIEQLHWPQRTAPSTWLIARLHRLSRTWLAYYKLQASSLKHRVTRVLFYTSSAVMALIDRITDVVAKFTPTKQSNSMSGNGHGIVPFDDDNVSSCSTSYSVRECGTSQQLALLVPVAWTITLLVHICPRLRVPTAFTDDCVKTNDRIP